MGRSHLMSDGSQSFSRETENLAASNGLQHMSHMMRENYDFRDQQMMTHVLTNPWLYEHPGVNFVRRFSVDSDKNSMKDTYERNLLVNRRYIQNSLRPTDYSAGYEAWQNEDGEMDFIQNRRALHFMSVAKEERELRSAFKPLTTLNEKITKGEVLPRIEEAHKVFTTSVPGERLSAGSYDTAFSQNKVSGQDIKGAIVNNDDNRLVKYGNRVSEAFKSRFAK
ncbi:MAG: hypothetical protein IJC39_03795, partial [Firmicutes bacterium]|nr:hypothetical protein [Bacillota bacterium]